MRELVRINKKTYTIKFIDDSICDLTLQTGIISAAMVLNEMRRLTEAAKPKALDETPVSTPTLILEPVADCSRYDSLRSTRHAH